MAENLLNTGIHVMTIAPTNSKLSDEYINASPQAQNAIHSVEGNKGASKNLPLPPELRLHVYEYLLSHPGSLVLEPATYSNLRLTSRVLKEDMENFSISQIRKKLRTYFIQANVAELNEDRDTVRVAVPVTQLNTEGHLVRNGMLDILHGLISHIRRLEINIVGGNTGSRANLVQSERFCDSMGSHFSFLHMLSKNKRWNSLQGRITEVRIHWEDSILDPNDLKRLSKQRVWKDGRRCSIEYRGKHLASVIWDFENRRLPQCLARNVAHPERCECWSRGGN